MQVRVTDGTLTEAVPRISEADLQGSRHRISLFLSTHTVYELLPESGKVWMLFHCPFFLKYIYVYIILFDLFLVAFFKFDFL